MRVFYFKNTNVSKDLIYDDTFNILNIKGVKQVLYVSEGKLFYTFCENVSSILVPSKVSDCTSDLPVYIKNNAGSLEMVFLTHEKLILRKKTKKTICKNDNFQVKNFLIKKVGREIYIRQSKNNNILFINKIVHEGQINSNKKFSEILNATFLDISNSLNNSINNSSVNTKNVSFSFSAVQHSLQNGEGERNLFQSLEKFYKANIDDNEIIKFFRDLILIFVVLIMIMFASKNKMKDCFLFLKSIYAKKYGIHLPHIEGLDVIEIKEVKGNKQLANAEIQTAQANLLIDIKENIKENLKEDEAVTARRKRGRPPKNKMTN